MGKDLAEVFPQAKARFEEADSILQYSLSRLCWEGPAEALTRTEHCQPALYVASMAALAALQAESQRCQAPQCLAPTATGGLSLGEYTALAADGAVSFQDGLKLVHLRGQEMEEAAQAAPGTMASILGLELEPVQAICSETGAEVANLNAPGQIVISGTPQAVEAASAKAKEKGAKRVIPLEVGGAFHSRLMQPAVGRLQQAIERVAVQGPAFPVFSNVTGAYYSGPDQVKVLLVQQLTHPVRWVECIQTLIGDGIRFFLEVGPGTVLKGLVRKIDPETEVLSVGTADQVRETVARLAQSA